MGAKTKIKLTPKQERFCQEYILLIGNAKQAAINAGYSKNTAKQMGYENLTSEAVQTAMETINDFDPMEWGAPYTWTPTDHQGTTGCLWYKWAEGGTMVRVSDWISFEPLPQEWRTTAWWLKD